MKKTKNDIKKMLSQSPEERIRGKEVNDFYKKWSGVMREKYIAKEGIDSALYPTDLIVSLSRPPYSLADVSEYLLVGYYIVDINEKNFLLRWAGSAQSSDRDEENESDSLSQIIPVRTPL